MKIAFPLKGFNKRASVKAVELFPFHVGVLDVKEYERPDGEVDHEKVKKALMRIGLVVKEKEGFNSVGFLYGYVVREGKVYYYVVPAYKGLLGERIVPFFYKALMKEGCYEYEKGEIVLTFFSTANEVIVKSGYKKKNCEKLAIGHVGEDVPKTLVAKWSEEVKEKALWKFALLFFAFSVVAHFVWAEKKIEQKVVKPVVVIERPKSNSLLKLIKFLNEMGSMVKDGKIKKIRIKGDNYEVVIKFPNKEKATAFLMSWKGHVDVASDDKLIIRGQLR